MRKIIVIWFAMLMFTTVFVAVSTNVSGNTTGSKSTPGPNIYSVVYPTEINLGETATIKVSGTNTGGQADEGNIDIAFPSNPDSAHLEIYDHDITNPDNAKICWTGDKIWGDYGQTPNITVQYPVAEIAQGNWANSETHYLTVKVTPTETGNFTFYVKMTAGFYDGEWWGDPAKNGSTPNTILDQQNEYVYVYTITVKESTTNNENHLPVTGTTSKNTSSHPFWGHPFWGNPFLVLSILLSFIISLIILYILLDHDSSFCAILSLITIIIGIIIIPTIISYIYLHDFLWVFGIVMPVCTSIFFGIILLATRGWRSATVLLVVGLIIVPVITGYLLMPFPPSEEVGAGETLWITKASMPTARMDMGAGVVAGKIYVIGGWGSDSKEDLSIVECYDISTDSWSMKRAMPTARRKLAVAVVDNKIYAIGGHYYDGDYHYLSTVECYDPLNDTWTTKASMPTARTTLAVGVVNDKIYAIGGCYYSGPKDSRIAHYVSTVECYDTSNDMWTAKASMPTARADLAVGVVNGKIYAIGGNHYDEYGESEEDYSLVECYDPSTDSWSKEASMSAARTNFGVCVVNNKIYAIGGVTGTSAAYSVTSSVEIYDPYSDTWTTSESMSTPRAYLAVSAVGGKIYVVGGFKPGPHVFSLVEVYTIQEEMPEEIPISHPDLILSSSDILFSKEGVVNGDTLTLTAVIHNNGLENASNVVVCFYDEDVLIGSDTVDVLAGNITNASVQWDTSNVAGIRTIGVKIDESNSIIEENEKNNNASTTIMVHGADLTLSSADVSFSKENIVGGDTVTITAVVRNDGVLNASNVVVRFYDTDILVGEDIVSVPAGGTAETSVQWDVGFFSFGDRNIKVVVNPKGGVIEETLSNNKITLKVYIIMNKLLFPISMIFAGVVFLIAGIISSRKNIIYLGLIFSVIACVDYFIIQQWISISKWANLSWASRNFGFTGFIVGNIILIFILFGMTRILVKGLSRHRRPILRSKERRRAPLKPKPWCPECYHLMNEKKGYLVCPKCGHKKRL
ncbi:MAG: hypothetical protein KJ886_03545 [Candidatus Thermoplasmatota archaeon]|nr:hypothetical protein [Candidatus Thermoplasmatota archaeon]MBU4256499.1 hypothetical protein [Candidatus Thermoplasmatota archaeon]MCG2826476.1 hypothetical protein [Thermoplasmatales archaeon]